MDAPSIKGTAFASAVADLEAVLEAGRLSREQLEARLQPEDLHILESKVLPGEWYPIDSYGRIIDLLGDVEAGGSVRYHVQRGRRAAERLLQSGIYRQLDRARSRRSDVKNVEAASQLIEVMLTVGRSLYNFGSWELLSDEPDDRTLAFEIRDAAALPESARYTIQGFVEWAAERIGGDRGVRVESRRVRRDCVRMEIRIL